MKNFPTLCPWMKNDDPIRGLGPVAFYSSFPLTKGSSQVYVSPAYPRFRSCPLPEYSRCLNYHPWFPELLWLDPDPSGFCHSSPLPNPQTPLEKESSKKPPFMIYVPFPANDLQSWSPRTPLSVRNCKLSPRDCFLFPPAHLGWLSIVTGHPVHIRKKGTTWGWKQRMQSWLQTGDSLADDTYHIEILTQTKVTEH